MPPDGVRWRARRGTGTSPRRGAGSALASSPTSGTPGPLGRPQLRRHVLGRDVAHGADAVRRVERVETALDRGARRPVVRRCPARPAGSGPRAPRRRRRTSSAGAPPRAGGRPSRAGPRSPRRRDDRRVREPVDGRGQGAGLDLDLQQRARRSGPSTRSERVPTDPAPLGRPAGLVLGAQLVSASASRSRRSASCRAAFARRETSSVAVRTCVLGLGLGRGARARPRTGSPGWRSRCRCSRTGRCGAPPPTGRRSW